MFEKIWQELGAVLQQSFLETDPWYFLSLATFGLGDRSVRLGDI